MIISKFTILAKSVTIDSLSNQLSISNIIEELQTPKLPSLLPESYLVSLFERNEKKDKSIIPASVTVYLNDKKLGGQNFNIDFQQVSRNRTVMTLPLLELNEFGVLKFEMIVKGKVVGSYDVKILESQQLLLDQEKIFKPEPKMKKKSLKGKKKLIRK